MVQGQTPHLEMGPWCDIGYGFLIRWKKCVRTTIDPRAIQPRLPPAYRKRSSLSTRLRKLSTQDTFRLVLRTFLGNFVKSLPSLTAKQTTGEHGKYHCKERQPHEPEIHMGRRTWIRWSASMVFECFSQRMCLTLTAVAAFNPLPCRRPSRSAHNRIKKGSSMSRTFPPLSAVSSAFPLLFLSLEDAPFAISVL